MIISCFGASVFLFILATYTYLKSIGSDLDHFSWIPIVSLSLVIFIASIGIIALPFVITTELMPNKVRSAIVAWAFT